MRSSSRRGIALWNGILIILTAVVVGSVLWTIFARNFFPHDPLVGKQLETLAIQPLTTDAKPIGLADLRGKVTVVNFWGTWCPPCVAEFPLLAALEKHHRGNPDFLFLGISCGTSADDDLGELRASTEAFLRRGGYELPMYADASAVTRAALSKWFGGFAYPTTLLIDRNGTIVGSWVGFSPSAIDEMKLRVAGMLQAGK